MKTTLLIFAVLGLSCCPDGSAFSQQSAATYVLPVQTIQAIQGNAGAIQRNAPNFLWRRVDHEMSRIIADEKVLEQTTPDTPARRQAGDSLRQAILELRSASQGRDADLTVAAARKVGDDCARLLK